MAEPQRNTTAETVALVVTLIRFAIELWKLVQAHGLDNPQRSKHKLRRWSDKPPVE